MPSIFTKIINGEIPCYKIAEDENYFAFLDIYPVAKGHTLIIPKIEVDNFFDLEDDVYTGLMLFSKKISKAMKKAIPCERIGVTVIGLEVPHAHVHLIPLNGIYDMNFEKQKLKLTEDTFKSIAVEIASHL